MSARPTPEQRKREIIEAAVTVFAQKGFEGASMDDIVAASGLSKGGLYWHFNSKDELIMAILQRFFDQEIATLEAVMSAPGPVPARLQHMAHQIAAEMEAMIDLLSISLEFYAVAARQEPVRRVISNYFAAYRTRLSALLQLGIDRGELAIASPTSAATTLIAFFEGLVLMWAIDPNLVDLAAQAETGVSFLLRGWRADPGPMEEEV